MQLTEFVDAVKAVLRGRFIALNDYFRKKDLKLKKKN